MIIRNTLAALLICLSAGAAVQAETVAVAKERKRSFWWKLSVATLAAATAVDGHSSWGRIEVNPVLRGGDGRFGSRGVAIKALVFTATAGVQHLLLKKHPQAEKPGIVTNFGLAGVLAAAAAVNYSRHPAGRVLEPPSGH